MMTPVTDQQITSELFKYGATPDHAQCEAIRRYIELLLKWNRALSLTTITDVSEILRFHIGESLLALSAGLIDKGRLADVGSGAGLPGVPLAVFSGQLDVTLIESNAKKTAFLSEVKRSLGLDNLHVVRSRFESADLGPARFDFVTARALGRYDELLAWTFGRITPRGRVVLWIGAEDAQLVSSSVGWSWQAPRKIVGSANRVFLVGEARSAECST